MAHDNDKTRDMANRGTGDIHHWRRRSDVRRRPRATTSRREAIQMLLPVRRPERNGLMPEKNVRAPEI